MTLVRPLCLIAAVGALAGACNGGVADPDPDSETHWLARCDDDTDCGRASSCLCGICTTSCDDAAACGTTVAADCLETKGSCGPSVDFVCVATCDGASCPSGTTCRTGLCLPTEEPAFSIENPTGECVATTDGGRPGHHSPGPDSVYLHDCQLDLNREYFRVFATSPDSAYTIPRLDGAPMLSPLCSDSTYPESAIVERYGLCKSAETAAEVDRVNDMDPADALRLTHWLHGQLVFRGTDQGVAPYPFPDDVLDACALHETSNSPELVTLCDEERDRMDSGNDIGLSYAAVGLELARLLNELYGIEATELAVFGPELCSLPADSGMCFGDFTQYRYDPAAASCVPFTWGGCGGNANRFETLDACNEYCGDRRAHTCSPAGACAACPVELDSSGLACADEGLECGFGGCGGGTCRCVPDGAGDLVWECRVNAC